MAAIESVLLAMGVEAAELASLAWLAEASGESPKAAWQRHYRWMTRGSMVYGLATEPVAASEPDSTDAELRQYDDAAKKDIRDAAAKLSRAAILRCVRREGSIHLRRLAAELVAVGVGYSESYIYNRLGEMRGTEWSKNRGKTIND